MAFLKTGLSVWQIFLNASNSRQFCDLRFRFSDSGKEYLGHTEVFGMFSPLIRTLAGQIRCSCYSFPCPHERQVLEIILDGHNPDIVQILFDFVYKKLVGIEPFEFYEATGLFHALGIDYVLEESIPLESDTEVCEGEVAGELSRKRPGRTRSSHRICQFCGKDYHASTKFKKHVATHFQTEIMGMYAKGQECLICGKKINPPSVLLDHIANVHDRLKYFVDFEKQPDVHKKIQKISKETHDRLVNDPEFMKRELKDLLENMDDLEHLCRLCGKKNLGKPNQRIHINIHFTKVLMSNYLKLEGSPFICPICGRDFAKSYALCLHYGFAHNIYRGIINS